MKALSLALAVTIGLPAASAGAAIITIGNPLAQSCYERAERKDVHPSSLEVCVRALSEGLDVDNQAATLVNRGIIRMARGEYGGADADFDAALQLRPNLADSWLNKGFLRLRVGDGAGALPLLEKALELRARRPALAYFARGLAHEQAGNVSAAYADLRRAHALEPGWHIPAQELSRYRVVQR